MKSDIRFTFLAGFRIKINVYIPIYFSFKLNSVSHNHDIFIPIFLSPNQSKPNNHPEILLISYINTPNHIPQPIQFSQKLIILCEGSIIYDGPPDAIGPRLMSMGFKMPKFTSPTDYLMKIIDKDEIRVEYESKHAEVPSNDTQAIEKMFQERLNILRNFENLENFVSKKSILSQHKSVYRLSMVNLDGGNGNGGKRKDSKVSLDDGGRQNIVMFYFKYRVFGGTLGC